jgi:ABC-type phosphate/phosphonate transport system ATPase subunit
MLADEPITSLDPEAAAVVMKLPNFLHETVTRKRSNTHRHQRYQKGCT